MLSFRKLPKFSEWCRRTLPEAEFVDVIRIQVSRVFLFAIYSQLCKWILPPPPHPSKSGLKLVCTVNIVYENLKSENSRLCPETSAKLYIHEFGFGSHIGVGGDKMLRVYENTQ
jgi:hypothetical protein